ncbi:MAG: cadherin repeat domain-containing protein, partial [Pirellulaceae bacterium]|nr:cadherin repeat domain-containing protein [Pirellulaceae bacterium]
AGIGLTYARFRIGIGSSGFGPTGNIYSGEVEDYAVTIFDPNLVVNLPNGNGADDVTLRKNGLNLEVYDNQTNALILSQLLAATSRITVNGTNTEPDRLTVDYSYGGFFALPEGVYFNGGTGLGDSLIVKGTGATSFNFVSSGGSIGNAAIEAFDWIERDTIRFTGVEPLSILNAIDINVTGGVNVGNQILTLDSAGFTTLGQTTTLTGGTINAPSGLVLATGQTVVGRGAINAPIYSAPGSTITLNGNLALGDANAFDGIDLHGRLNVGAFTVTLNDGYKAVLGSQTTIGTLTVDGILNAPNGIALEDNQTLVGRGVINTTNGSFENQGHVQGQSAAAKIKFSQLVTGRGSFANVEFNGGSSLGNSPTLTDMQGATSFGTTNVHTVEIGGLIAGSEFDKIQSTGTVILGGALDVKLIAINNGYTPTLGQSFTIVSAAQVNGTFSSASFPPSILGGSWKINYSPTAVTVQLSGSTPIDLTASNLLIPENLQPSLFLSALSAIDPDTIEQHTYSLVSGDGSTDNGVFEIVGNQLRPKQVFDFETKSIYSIRIKVVDAAGLEYEKSLSIGVVDMTEVAAVTIGDGSAQRSLLKQVKVTFDGLVDITNLNSGTFTVRKRDSGMATIANNAIISTIGAGASAQTVVTLSFTGSFVESNGSLANGNYELVIDANNIVRTGLGANTRLDGNRDGTAGGNFRFGSNAQNQVALTDAFFRLLGDFSGSGAVDNADLGMLNTSFRKKLGQSGFNPDTDVNEDSVIDNRDVGIFNPLFRSKRSEA